MRTKTQDPKYDIENGKLVNATTGVPIPDDEPVFILRAKDVNASQTILNYARLCRNSDHKASVLYRFDQFCDFSSEHPERMKEPDTTSPPVNSDAVVGTKLATT